MKKLMCALLSAMVLVGCSSSSTIRTPKPDYEKRNNTTSVTFCAVGDNLIHTKIYKNADAAKGRVGDGLYDFNSCYTEVKDDLYNADLSFINQETILGGKSPSSYPVFCTPDDMINSLNYMGIDVANGSTNHSLDCGNSGIAHEIQVFKKNQKITLIGLYEKPEDEDTVWVIERNGIKFAFLSYTYGTNGIKGNGWNVSMFSRERIQRQVAKAKKMGDFVIVSAHWGTENVLSATSYQKEYAQLFADCGVDLVVGTHPHVIGPMEWRKGKDGNKTLIIYSLGNFVSTQNKTNQLLEGMFSCTFKKSDDVTRITDIVWTPLINHYETNAKRQKVYKLKNYPQSLASRHAVNAKAGQRVNSQYYINKTKQIIDGTKFKIDL